MKTLNNMLETYSKGFIAPKHEQGVRKPGVVAPPKVFKDNTPTSKQGKAPAPTLGAQEFIDDHEVNYVPDANGNGDDVFKATNIKHAIKKEPKHGYTAKKSEDVNEKTLTMAELAKRKEIADAIKRDHPEYSDEKKMRIATAMAKKVAEEEEVDQFDSIFEAMVAEKYSQEVEAVTTMLEAMYDSLEDDAAREQFMEMLESDEDFEKLLSLVETALSEEEESNG